MMISRMGYYITVERGTQSEKQEINYPVGQSTIKNGIVLQCIALHCIALHCIALHCIE